MLEQQRQKTEQKQGLFSPLALKVAGATIAATLVITVNGLVEIKWLDRQFKPNLPLMVPVGVIAGWLVSSGTLFLSRVRIEDEPQGHGLPKPPVTESLPEPPMMPAPPAMEPPAIDTSYTTLPNTGFGEDYSQGAIAPSSNNGHYDFDAFADLYSSEQPQPVGANTTDDLEDYWGR